MLNGLTLRILRWYKWLRFKDIVQGFRKLKKRVEKKIEWNGMVCRIRKLNSLEQYRMECNEWNDLSKHGVKKLKGHFVIIKNRRIKLKYWQKIETSLEFSLIFKTKYTYKIQLKFKDFLGII